MILFDIDINSTRERHTQNTGIILYMDTNILLTAALLKLKVFHTIPLACFARELLSMQGKLVHYKQAFSETKLL